MRYREIIEAIENDDDMFGSSERTKNFRGWTVQQVKDHFDDLNSGLYGSEAYWGDDNDPEFVRKENELKAMMQYARIRFGEDFYQYLSNWREYSDRQMARYDDRTSADPFNNTRYYSEPRMTKTGKMYKQDQSSRANRIQARLGRHHRPVLPESDDDELFGSAPSAATLTQSIARAIVRSDKSARLITSPFMVGFALGKTPGGEPLLHYWKSIGKDKQDAMLDGINDAVYDLIANKVTENDESDDELFGAGGEKVFLVLAPDDEILNKFSDIRQAIAYAKKQIPSYLEDGWGDDDFITVYKHNWGDWGASGVPVAHYPITDDPIDESDDDDDLFASPTIRFGDFFNEWDEDQLQALGFSYGDHPEQDVDIINHYLEDGGAVNWRVLKLTGAEDGQGDDIVLHLDRSSRLGEEESDDEMFGVSGSAAQRMIYKFGKQMLAKLEQAYNNPRIKAEYQKLIHGEEPDANRLFDLVCRSTSTPFGKAIVVDAILREYAEQFNGLNDFGTLIDSGEWHQEMVEMWDMFGNDPDVAQQDWFQKEIQTFMGDR